MNKKQNEPDYLRADAVAQLTRALPTSTLPSMPIEELLHELRVHQIELEMQNDELRRVQVDMEKSRDRYVNLYDFAPVGYFTLTREGMIAEVNLTGTALLGVERKQLINRHFAGFITSENKDLWHCHFLRVLQREGQQNCELVLKRSDDSLIHAQLDCLHINDSGLSSIRIAITDITEHKRAEVILNSQLTNEIAKRTSELSALTAHVQKIAEVEKASLARELHDELGSALVGISMEVGRLRGKISDPDHLQDLSLIKELLSNAAEIKRRVVSQLYPTVLDDCGFSAAVVWLVNEYRKHSGIEVELLLPKEEFVIEHTFALAAYRISQECLTNIAKHAGANKVHIETKISDGFFDLTIQDNGKGLSGGKNAGGHGIFGMIERARFLGGAMEIGGEDGKGTTAHLRLPMAAPTTQKI